MFLCEVKMLDKDQKVCFLTSIQPTGLSSLWMSRSCNGLFATDFSVQRVFPIHKKKDIWIVDYWTKILSRHSSNRSPHKLHGNKEARRLRVHRGESLKTAPFWLGDVSSGFVEAFVNLRRTTRKHGGVMP